MEEFACQEKEAGCRIPLRGEVAFCPNVSPPDKAASVLRSSTGVQQDGNRNVLRHKESDHRELFHVNAKILDTFFCGCQALDIAWPADQAMSVFHFMEGQMGNEIEAGNAGFGGQKDELLRCLVDNITDYAILLLDAEGRVLTWSPAAEKLKGWKENEVIGQSIGRFYPPEDVRNGKPERELQVAASEGRFEDEGWRIRKDGTLFWANVIFTALRDRDGNLLGYGKITRDLTERRAAEEKIRRQAQEIMEMAAVPVVQIWKGIVLVPLIGTLDSMRTQQLMERLLEKVSSTGSPVAVIDITGVPTIDTQTAQHLLETISAVRLLGAEVVMTGVRPNIAQTLVHLGISLADVATRSSLSAGLQLGLNLLRLKVVSDVA